MGILLGLLGGLWGRALSLLFSVGAWVRANPRDGFLAAVALSAAMLALLAMHEHGRAASAVANERQAEFALATSNASIKDLRAQIGKQNLAVAAMARIASAAQAAGAAAQAQAAMRNAARADAARAIAAHEASAQSPCRTDAAVMHAKGKL